MKRLPRRTTVIVGGGLTASLVARQLTAAGVDVLVLERGGNDASGAESTLPSQRDELRWDVRQTAMQDWSVETFSLRHDAREEALPMRWNEAFMGGDRLGGTGSHWNGITLRWAEYEPMLRSHYEQRYGKASIPADMPLQDWGVTYAELEPYHHLFEKLFGVAGKAGNINGTLHAGGNPFEAPRRDEYPLPPLEEIEAARIFREAATAVGYSPFPLPGANASRPYTNPDGQSMAACQYCGHCDRFICDVNAKGTPDLLLYPMLAKRKGFEARVRAHVLEVLYDQDARKATGVRYVDLATGEELEQPADVVVLAAFTMTNVRLLLSARIGQAYDPASATGVVGKNFCYQTTSWIPVFYRDRWINPFIAGGCTGHTIDDLNADNFDHAGLGFLGGAQVSGAVFHGRPIKGRRLPPGTPRWGTQWKQANADWYAHQFALSAWGSCYPDRGNYLDLDPDYTDAFGQPLLRMTFDWRANELKMSAYVADKMHEIARASGATVIGPATPRTGPYDTRGYQSTHLTGGTVMGREPATSVVSSHLQHWDAENVFVVGSSVYAHNSGSNPTGPLAALALRLGDDVAEYVKRPRML